MSYEFFDSIICINLKHRTDRRQYVSQLFNKMGITDLVTFYYADKSPKGGMYGCFESHINVIRSCYNKGDETILIFEDDIIPTASYSLENIATGIKFMQNPQNPTYQYWDLFYYGFMTINEQWDNIFLASHITPNIIKYRPNATHAYCISRKGMSKILNTYHRYIGKVHLDEFLTCDQLAAESYCMVPMLFEQRYCLPHDNQAFKLTHEITRANMCLAEKTKINYTITFIVWFMNKAYWWLFICAIILIFLLSFLIIAH